MLNTIAEFASRLSYRDLPPIVVAAAKDHLLDSIGCGVAATDSDAARIARALAGPASRPDLGGRIIASDDVVAADAAAFVNSCKIRKLDFNDSFPGAHPSDMLGGLLAVAPQHGASGEQLITASVVAYEVLIRLLLGCRFHKLGWDQGFALAVGTAAGLGNLIGLDQEKLEHAISLAAVGNMPLRATRAGRLSMWKGAAAAYAIRNAVFCVQLAAEGMTGPEAPFTGRDGLFEKVSGPFELKPFGSAEDDFVTQRSKLKYWPVVYNGQALVWAGIELRKQVALDQLADIEIQTYWSGWSESASEPAKWDPKTRETADHSFPYILAWTLRHGRVDQNAFTPDAYLDPTMRPLMNIMRATIDEEFSKAFPDVIQMRLRARDHAGKTYEVHVVNPLGHEANPITGDELAEKVRHLMLPVLGPERTSQAITAWQNIDAAATLDAAFDAISLGSDAGGAARTAAE